MASITERTSGHGGAGMLLADQKTDGRLVLKSEVDQADQVESLVRDDRIEWSNGAL